MRTGADKSDSHNGSGRGSSNNAFSRTPQAKDDQFLLDAMVGNDEQIYMLDVLANDSGGKAKSLWSVDDGNSSEGVGTADLLIRDIAGIAEHSALGAHISITDDGKIAYAYTQELRDQLSSLSSGEILTDTFTYAIQLGNGVLSWATATVEIAGVNDPPVLSGSMAVLADAEANHEYTQYSYMIFEKDLLTGFTDPDGDSLSVTDLAATSGSLYETAGGWVFYPDSDFTGTVELHYTVIDEHGGSTAATQSFMVTDTLNPALVSSTPWDEGVLKVDQNIVLDFDEPVVTGSGSIIISNGTDTRTIDINDTSQVTVTSGKKGGSIIIDPTDDLVPDTNYNIQIASGAILDNSGNAYAGINDPETLDFMTIVSDPLLSWSEPWDEGFLKVDRDIVLYFDEPVMAGSGEIIISNGTDIRTIDVNDAGQVTFDEYGGVVINPTDDLVSGTNYNIQMASGVIVDEAGFAYAGIHDAETLDFDVVTASPLLVYSDPMDEFTEFQVDSDIRLDFDEMVVAGSGAIIISNGTDTRTIDINDASQVMFDGYSGVIINPAEDLEPNTIYNIQMANGVIVDLEGHAYEGINDSETLNFTTIPSNPVLYGSYPMDESIFKIDGDFSFYFNEMVIPGSGNIIISNGVDTRTIDIQDATQIMFDGYGGVMIDPVDDLMLGETYHVLIDSGAITDMAGHGYEGISDPETLNFMTIASDPLLQFSTPSDDGFLKFSNNIELLFDEEVMPGSGVIVISNGTDTREIDIHDTSQVTFSGSKTSIDTVIIDPTDDLIAGTEYNIQMAAGVIQDLDGHAYAGINDPGALNFTTLNSDPLLLGSYPYDDQVDFWVDGDIYLYFDEMVMAGSGNVIISNGTDTRTIDIQDFSQVMFDDYGNLFINPASDLIAGTNYYIQIDSGAIIDMEGNPYAGIHDETTLNFMTTDTMITMPVMSMLF